MNATRLLSLHVLVALLGMAYGSAALGDNTIHTYWSPHHRYCCRLQAGKAWGGETIIFEDVRDHKSKNFFATDRCAEVLWSPEDAWFSIEDDWDPDLNRLHVYHISPNGSIEEIWSTFDVAPHSYWKVLGWRMDQGTIHVRCDYEVDYNNPSKGTRTKSYFVPLFLPEQFTIEEQFIMAEQGLKKAKREK